MPPTMSILIELADLGSVEAVIKHARTGRSRRCCREWWKRRRAGNFGIRG